MNKFEKLIEYIINDEDQKARELFHDIVVEKSRDIYESIMDEEQVEEQVHGDQVGDMVDEIGHEEAVGEDEDEFADAGEEELGGDEDLGGEESGEEFGDDEVGGEENIDDKVMNIDAKLDELLAKFDEIMGDVGGEEPAGDDMGDMGAEEPAMDMGAEEPAPEQFAEGEQPEWLKANSGKAGTSESGKSGKSGKSGASGKSGSGKMESKGTAELMREYVDKIQDMNLTGASEGDAVGGAGKKTSVNTKSITGPGADFGGTAVSAKGGEQNQDGTSAPASPKPQEIKSGNVNTPGGNAGKSGFKTKEGEYSTEHGKEGQTTSGTVPVAKKSVQVQNTGKK
jgi:hypothetical protein